MKERNNKTDTLSNDEGNKERNTERKKEQTKLHK